jgi:hypothetical protein
LRDLALTMARLCGWDGKPQTSVTVNTAVQTGVITMEERRMELIEQRNFILALEGNKPNKELLAEAIHAAREGHYQDASQKLQMAFVHSARHGGNPAFQTEDVKRRMELVEQRNRILAQQVHQRKVSASASLPAPETKLQRATGLGNAAPVGNGEEKNSAPTGDKSAVPPSQPDPVYQRMQSVGNAGSWPEEERV